MKREDVIDLGVASEQTMGPGGDPIDEFLGDDQVGLSDD